MTMGQCSGSDAVFFTSTDAGTDRWKRKTKGMMHLHTVPGERGKAVVTDHFLLVIYGPLAVEPFKKLTVQRCFLFLFMEYISTSNLGQGL